MALYINVAPPMATTRVTRQIKIIAVAESAQCTMHTQHSTIN